jgi:hypothetical protein
MKREFKPGEQAVIVDGEGQPLFVYIVAPEKGGYRCTWIAKSGKQEFGWFPAEALQPCN